MVHSINGVTCLGLYLVRSWVQHGLIDGFVFLQSYNKRGEFLAGRQFSPLTILVAKGDFLAFVLLKLELEY